MNQASNQERALPAIAAAGLILCGAVAGQPVLGVVCGVAAGLGLFLRAQPKSRKSGSAILLMASVGFAIGLLSLSGYRIGKDMAHRDSTRPSSVHSSSP